VRKLRNLLTVLAIIAVLDFGFSSYCRDNCEFWNDAYPSTDHRIRSEAYHHGLAPNLEINEAWGMRRYAYATNSLGFKDSAPRTVSLRSDKRRMLFLGDSFTEGKGFPFEQTFVGLIAREMERRGVEVLNGGVDSYAPAIYLRKTRHLIEETGLKLETVVVFLDVSDIYDQAVRYGYDDRGELIIEAPEEPSPPVAAYRYLRDRSATVRMVSLAFDHLVFFGRYAKRRVEIAITEDKAPWKVTPLDIWAHAVTDLKFSAWTYDDRRWHSFGERGRGRAKAEMDKLAELLKRHGTRMVLAVYPWPDQLFHDPEAPRHRSYWRQWAEARAIPFVDLFPAFTEGDPKQTLEDLFIHNDFHWNADGHRRITEVFMASQDRFVPF